MPYFGNKNLFRATFGEKPKYGGHLGFSRWPPPRIVWLGVKFNYICLQLISIFCYLWKYEIWTFFNFPVPAIMHLSPSCIGHLGHMISVVHLFKSRSLGGVIHQIWLECDKGQKSNNKNNDCFSTFLFNKQYNAQWDMLMRDHYDLWPPMH